MISKLIEFGLLDRFPDICHTWHDRKISAAGKKEKKIEEMTSEILATANHEAHKLEASLRYAITQKILESYPYVILWLCDRDSQI